LTCLSGDDNLGMNDLSSSIDSFQLNFDVYIDSFLEQWQSELDDITLQSSMNSLISSKIDQPIPAKVQIGGLFDIPLPELKFHSNVNDQANRYAEQQLNRSYAIELNPNEKLGDFRLRVPDMAIQVDTNVYVSTNEH
jgi:hypothetical protein